ncbi:MAG: hypothetical protein V3R99_00690, partial [Thermoguttaceae bacterium]
AGPVTGLPDTDALLNIQQNGQLYFGSEVLDPGVDASGDIAGITLPWTVEVDLHGVAAGSEVTLYFDLLGFGEIDSSVVIDNVRLTSGRIPPLEFELDPATDSGLLGDDLTRFTEVNLIGTTDPLLEVLLDVDGDGFDDGSVTADGADQFLFTGVLLAEGENPIRMQTTNIDATAEAARTITVDTQAPTGALVAPAAGSLINQELGYVDVQWTDPGAAGLDPGAFDPGDVTLSGVSIDRIEEFGGGLVRYWYNDDGDTLREGTVEVALAAGAVSDLAGNPSVAGAASFVFQPPGGEEVRIEEVVINDGDAQRSNLEKIAIRFSRATNLPELIDNETVQSAVKLHRASGPQVPLESSRFDYDETTFTLTIDLTSDGFGGGLSTILADGRYRLGLDTDAITGLVDDDGMEDGIRRIFFHRLLGDFNGNAEIDLEDRIPFFAHYGTSAGDELYAFAFDLNTDGRINAEDYYVWKGRFGISLPPTDPGVVASVDVPPVVTAVRLNGQEGLTVSSIDASVGGIRSIEVVFSEPVSFSEDGAVQVVSFPGGVSIPVTVDGLDTERLTITLSEAAVDTWVKVTLDGSGLIADAVGNPLDGDPAAEGSGREYLFDADVDLPSGDAAPGGDVVFYVGSLRGDLNGNRQVENVDLNLLLSALGSSDESMNLDGIGVVDDDDVAILVGNFGNGLCSLPLLSEPLQAPFGPVEDPAPSSGGSLVTMPIGPVPYESPPDASRVRPLLRDNRLFIGPTLQRPLDESRPLIRPTRSARASGQLDETSMLAMRRAYVDATFARMAASRHSNSRARYWFLDDSLWEDGLSPHKTNHRDTDVDQALEEELVWY